MQRSTPNFSLVYTQYVRVAEEEALRGTSAVVPHRGVGVPRRAEPDAAEPAAPGRDLRVEHRGRRGAQAQGGGPHDPGCDARGAVETGGAHGGDAVHELGL